MDSPSDNESYHTGEESSDDGDDRDERHNSEGGFDCDDDDDDDDDDEKNYASKTRRQSKKKGKASSATLKQSSKGTTKSTAKPRAKGTTKSRSEIETDETFLPQPDISNLKDHYTESHRIAFNNRYFSKKSTGNEVCKPREERDHIYDVVKKWNHYKELEAEGELDDDDLEQWRQFRRTNHGGFEWVKKFSAHTLLLPTGVEKPILRRLEAKKDAGKNEPKFVGRIVLCKEECFDAIHEAHRLRGHLGSERTWTALTPKYFNITQQMVRAYCKTCHICMEKNPVITGFKGAKKPIMSHSWRDRFQIDLIDLRKFPRKNVYGVTMRWIMTVKDHSTGLTAVFALPRKMAKYVAYELDKYFGLVGYPTIFHTDNGNEFTAKVVVDMLKNINPTILTVTGRPRTPRDQGSIERANKTVKRMLSDLCAERRKEGLDDNWTAVLGRLTSSLNSYHGRQTNSVSAYKAVFGTDYHLQTTCSVEEARLCNTVDELKGVIDDDGRLDRYLDGMKGDKDDDELFDNAIVDGGTELIQKGLSYWETESQSDSDDDNSNPISSYEELFGFNDEEPMTSDDCLVDNQVNVESPNHTINAAGTDQHRGHDSTLEETEQHRGHLMTVETNDALTIGNDVGNFLFEEKEFHIDNERPDEESTEMVSELVIGGVTDTNNEQSGMKDAASESQPDEGKETVPMNPVDGNIYNIVNRRRTSVFNLTTPVGMLTEDDFIYDSPMKRKPTEEVILSSSSSEDEYVISPQPLKRTISNDNVVPSSSSDDEAIMTQTLKNVPHQSYNDVTFRRLIKISDAWNHKSLIKHWETSTNFSYTCVKGRLHCDSCNFSAIVTDFDQRYEDHHVKATTWFCRTFIDPFLKMLYHVHHRSTEKTTTRKSLPKSYPVFLDIQFPFESWRQSVPPVINKIVELKSPHIVVLLFNGNHFAVLEMFLDKNEFIIFDGLDVQGTAMIRWSKHVTHVLATVGVISYHGKGK